MIKSTKRLIVFIFVVLCIYSFKGVIFRSKQPTQKNIPVETQQKEQLKEDDSEDKIADINFLDKEESIQSPSQDTKTNELPSKAEESEANKIDIKPPTEVKETIVKPPAEVKETIVNPPTEVKEAIVKPPPEVKETIAKPPTEAKETIVEPPPQVKETIVNPPTEVKETIVKPPTEVKETIVKPPTEAKETIVQPPPEVKETIAKPPPEVKENIVKPPTEIKESVDKSQVDVKESVVKPPEVKESIPQQTPVKTNPPEEAKSDVKSPANDEISKNEKETIQLSPQEKCELQAEEQASASEFEHFLSFEKEKNAPCDYMRQMGGYLTDEGVIDGDQFVCFDRAYQWNPKDCTVLSFGIGHDWSFDDAMAGYGCKVFSFDPNIDFKDHQRSENIYFFHFGVGESRSTQPQTERYEDILKMLHYVDKKIDYLKIVIGQQDISFFEDLFTNSPKLLKNIRQIGLMFMLSDIDENAKEAFPSDSRRKEIFKQLKRLECHGFQRLHIRTENLKNCHFSWNNQLHSSCYEVVYGNTQT